MSLNADLDRPFSVQLLELNRLIAEGLGDGDEADTVRERMDVYWARMTEEQRQRMRWLSVDLETLSEGRYAEPNESEEQKKWAQEELFPAWTAFRGSKQTDWLLSVLRGPSARGKLGAIPYLQGRAWDAAGFPEVGLQFLEFAARVYPQVAVIALELMRREGWMDRALAKAEAILADHPDDPAGLYFGGCVLLDTVRHGDDKVARNTLERIRQILTKANDALQKSSDELRGALEPGVVVTLGTCLTRLGETGKAIQLYDQYLRRYPRDGDVYALRGALKEMKDLPMALEDYQKAITLGTRTFLPYLHVARNFILKGQHAKAVRVCNVVLNNLNHVPDAAQALFYEVLAIGYARLGQSPNRVLENLDRAIDLDPNNERFRQLRNELVAAVQADRLTTFVHATGHEAEMSGNRLLDVVRSRVSSEFMDSRQLVPVG